MHPEAAVGPAATAPIRQHGEEGVFVDRVLTLADNNNNNGRNGSF